MDSDGIADIRGGSVAMNLKRRRGS